MKTITLNTTVISNAVATASNYAPKDGEFAGKIVLVGQEGKVEVKASDYAQTIIYKGLEFICSDITIDSFEAFSIDGKKLSTVLKAAKTADVQIDIKADEIVVKSGRSKVKIETLAKTQDIQVTKGGIEFDFGLEMGHMERILHAVDTNNPKYELNGVLLQASGGVLNIVGTDSKRLARASTEIDQDFEVIVPKSGIVSAIKLFDGFDVRAYLNDSSLTIHTDIIDYEVRLTNGKYPAWQRIIPQSFAQTLTFSRTALAELLKEVSLFETEVAIEIKQGKIILSDLKKATVVEDSFEDENANMRFGVNSKLVLDFLASYEGEKVQLGFNDSNLPFMLIADSSYSEVIMPIVLADAQDVDADDTEDMAA
jgi:DNA polymerase-3 subunit beta